MPPARVPCARAFQVPVDHRLPDPDSPHAARSRAAATPSHLLVRTYHALAVKHFASHDSHLTSHVTHSGFCEWYNVAAQVERVER